MPAPRAASCNCARARSADWNTSTSVPSASAPLTVSTAAQVQIAAVPATDSTPNTLTPRISTPAMRRSCRYMSVCAPRNRSSNESRSPNRRISLAGARSVRSDAI